MSGDLVLVRTKVGRIHKAFERDGQRFTDERCQLDDAPGTEEPITFRELEGANPSDLCGHCFPVAEGDPA